jgi:hypothetical protein
MTVATPTGEGKIVSICYTAVFFWDDVINFMREEGKCCWE